LTDTVSGDNIDLPHVKAIEVTEKANIETRGVVDASLPHREFMGHFGRQVKVDGWIESLDDIDAIQSLQDGQLHSVTLPTGDSFPARLLNVTPDLNVNTPFDTVYHMTFDEALTTDLPGT
jgi:hypothetical protein